MIRTLFPFRAARLFVLGAGSLLVLGAGCSASTGAEKTTESSGKLDWFNVEPGRGYSLTQDSAEGFCTVDRATGGSPVAQQLDNSHGQEVEYALQMLESSTDMSKTMNIGVSASMHALAGGFDAKASFVSDSNLSSSSIYVFTKITVKNAPYTVNPLALDADSAAMLVAKNNDRFRQKCGDGYISAYVTGGEFYGLIEIQTSSDEERQQIKASVSGSYMTFSGQADFLNAVKSVTKNYSLAVHSYQFGGDDGNACSDINCIIGKAQTLPSSVRSTGGKLLDVSILPYTTLTLPADAESPLDVSSAQEVEQEIVEAKNLQKDWISKYNGVLTSPDQFFVSPSDITDIEGRINTLNGNVNTLRTAASACYNDYKQCAMPALASVVLAMPTPRPSDCDHRFTRTPSGAILDTKTGLSWSVKATDEQQYCDGFYGCGAPSADMLRSFFYGTPGCENRGVLASLPQGRYWTNAERRIDDDNYVGTWFDNTTGATGEENGYAQHTCICAQ